MEKFKGKFVEVCQYNWSGRRWTYFAEGYQPCQHCHCQVCEAQRAEQNLPRCTKEDRCQACRLYRPKPVT